MHKYPPDRFWHIVYGMRADQLTAAFELAKQRNAGWVYLHRRNGESLCRSTRLLESRGVRGESSRQCRPRLRARGRIHSIGTGCESRVGCRFAGVLAVGTEWQVFFDTDRNAKTGYDGGGLAIGAEYMLQGDASGAQLLRYTGSGADWSWKEVSARAQLDALDAHVWTASFDTAGLGGAGKMSYQIRALDASGDPLGDSYVLILDTANTGLVFDIFNHRQ